MNNYSIPYIDQLKHLRSLDPVSSTESNVVIIGAGMSGLTCAYELSRLGFNVTMLEAEKHHVGGRVRTLRDRIPNKENRNYAEVGAMRIPTRHTLTRFYAKEMGLTLRRFVQSNDRTWAYIRNMRVRRSKEGLRDVQSRFSLTESERKMSADDMWVMAVTSVVDSLTDEELTDLYETDFQTEKLQALDGMSLNTALQHAGLSQEAIEYLTSVYGLGTYLHSAFTEHLREEVERIWIDGFDEIVGGFDLLPKRMKAATKNAALVRGAKVSQVVRQGAKFTTTYIEDDGQENSIASDWVVCTAPLGTLSRIDLAGVISDEKSRAIRQVTYDMSTKVLIKCNRRFWEINDGIYGGGSIWDGGLGHTWYPSDNADAKDIHISNKPAYLLASYTWGQQAQRMDALHQQDLKGYVISELKKLHPDIDDSDISSVIRWSWANYSLSSGAFAFFSPNDQKDHYRNLKMPDGRFLLAGEHCSLSHSWVQGALESAIDVVTHIHKTFSA